MKDRLVTDDDQAGLYVRIGKKAQVGSLKYKNYLYKAGGAKTSLPSCTAISPAQAREAVRSIQGDLVKGLDPLAKAAVARKASPELTLAGLIDDWQALHLVSRRPKYANEATRALRVALKPYLEQPAAVLTKPAVIKVRDAMLRRDAGVMGDQVVRYGCACYGWGAQRGAVEANPFAGIPLAPRVRRDRVLDDHEITRIWHATGRDDPFDRIIRVLLWTGQRRSEVAGMRWSELTDDFAVWTIPSSRTKNHITHVVPLPPAIRGFLRGLPRTGELCFPEVPTAAASSWAGLAPRRP